MAEYINNAEYIDRKELVNNINRLVKLANKDEQEWVKDECIRQAYCLEKADVVPRSEVEELNNLIEILNARNDDLFEENERLMRTGCQAIKQAKQEVASKIIREIRNAIFAHGTKYAMKELEKIEKEYSAKDTNVLTNTNEVTTNETK